MRSEILIPGLMSMLLLISCNSNVVFEDFESGSMTKWKVDGDAFASIPATKIDVPDAKGYEGDGFLKTSSTSAVQGTLTSEPFIIEKKFVNNRASGEDRPQFVWSNNERMMLPRHKISGNGMSPVHVAMSRSIRIVLV